MIAELLSLMVYPDLLARNVALPEMYAEAAADATANMEPAAENPAPSQSPSQLDGIAGHWLELARCESGNWVDGGASFDGPIRWDWGAPGMQLPPWGTDLHHGGLQFAPSTWDWVAPDVLDDPPARAYDATPREQVAVAAEVQSRQGWAAWPVCSRRVGLR